MIFYFVETADGKRHVHAENCSEMHFQKAAGEVWEIEIPDDQVDDEAIVSVVWEDFLDEELIDEEALDTYFDLTVFRACIPDENSSGNPKADAFMDAAEDAGWDVEFVVDPDDEDDLRGYVVVKARREFIGQALRSEQVLDLSWSPTRLIEAHYLSGLPGEVAKKLSSVKGALAILREGPPRPRVNGKMVDREVAIKRIPKEKLPFDIEEAYDDEIIAAVQDHTLVWKNSVSENYETAYCLRQKNHIKIETGTAGRAILTFISPEGFRSLPLEELVQVK